MEAHGPSRQAAKQSVGWFRVQELHERISGCSGLHVPESLYSLCGRKAMLKKKKKKKLCEKKEVHVLDSMSLKVYSLCGCKATLKKKQNDDDFDSS